MESNSAIKRYWHLLFSVSIIFLATCVRVWISLKTGFILPDEALYFVSAKHYAEHGSFLYANRIAFQAFLAFLYRLGIREVWSFLSILPFMSWIFSSVFLWVLDGLIPMEYRRWTVLSLPFITVFSTLTPFVLTESVSLMLAISGLYYLKEKRYVRASVGFSLATLFREPYFLFLIGNSALLLLKDRRNAWKFIVPILCLLPFMFFGTQLNGLLYYMGVPIPKAGNLIPYARETFHIYSNPKPHGETLTTLIGMDKRLLYSFRNYFLGMILGWSVPFFILAHYGLITERHKIAKLDTLSCNSLFAFLSVFLSILYQTRVVFYTTLLCLTAISRLSHTALIGTVTMKTTKKLLLISIILSLIFVPYGLKYASDTVGFASKSPWLRLAEYASNPDGAILVYGEPIVRTGLFAPENVVVKIPRNETEFYLSLNDPRWEKILLYGEKHPNHYDALKENAPWYASIIVNKTLSWKVIWEDEHSYLYEVKRD